MSDRLTHNDVSLDLQAQAVTLLQVEQALRHLQGALLVDDPAAGELLQVRLRCELLRHSLHQLGKKIGEPGYGEGANVPSTATAAAGACGTEIQEPRA